MLKEIIENLSDVKTKWHPPEGTFTKEPEEIAKIVCKGHNGNLQKAVASVNFYYNRCGENCENKSDEIIKILHRICKGE